LDARILGHAGDELVDAALAAEHVPPELFGSSVKAVVGERGSRIQSSSATSVLELALAPAGVAGKTRGRIVAGTMSSAPKATGSPASRRAARLRRPGRKLPEHEHGFRLHRAADPDLVAVVDDRLELGHRAGHLNRGGAIETRPAAPLVGVLRHENHGPAEVRIE
jgi:hypothetical protein